MVAPRPPGAAASQPGGQPAGLPPPCRRDGYLGQLWCAPVGAVGRVRQGRAAFGDGGQFGHRGAGGQMAAPRRPLPSVCISTRATILNCQKRALPRPLRHACGSPRIQQHITRARRRTHCCTEARRRGRAKVVSDAPSAEIKGTLFKTYWLRVAAGASGRRVAAAVRSRNGDACAVQRR